MTIAAEEPALSFAQLVDRMTEGEPVTVTRQGKIAGRLLWEEAELETPEAKTLTVAEAIQKLEDFRKGNFLNGLSIREMINEGRP